MNQILLDAGIRFANGVIIYDYPVSILTGNFTQLRWRDTEANREKLANFITDRNLSVSDFRFPPKHKEIRGLYQATIDDANVTVSDDKQRSRADDIRSAVAEYREWKNAETWEQKTLREAAEAAAAEEAKLSEADRYARNEPQIDHATWQFLELAFSDCPAAEMTAAERRLQVARDGTPAQYSEADKAYRDRVKANAELRKAELQCRLQQEAEAVDAEIQSLQSAAWVDSTNPQKEETN